jgi:small subunit ribosomal protein S16
MLKIRLQRVGRTHEPKFRVVLTDSQNGPKSGKYVEVLGSYDARLDHKKEEIKADRIKHWISKGAQMSDTVHNLLVDLKVISGKKINALPKRTPIKKEGEAAAGATTGAEASAQSATPAAAEAPKAEEASATESPKA